MPFYGENCNRAGLYYRLSREDGDKRESDSIANQRALLHSFLKQHPEIICMEEYVDDGYSGTNFERPGFHQMMEAAKRNQINCIIVKDLSRLGRNYIETGRYLERIFPLMGIRFISVTDNYDTMDQDLHASSQMIVPFKNLINDAYCRDISKKVRSQFEIKRKNGQYIGGFAPYGYQKDPQNKHHFIVDTYAADIVRMIYDFRLRGMSTGRIAQQLNQMGILPPGAYKKTTIRTYHNGFKHRSESPIWMATQVRRILSDEMYTGTLVQGKKRKVSHRVNQYVPLPQEEWVRVADTHEPIVTKAVFHTVQDMWCMDTRTSPAETYLFPLSGKVRCGSCGGNMVRKRCVKAGKVYDYYTCAASKRGDSCTSHLIRLDDVDDLVLRMLQAEMRLLRNAQDFWSQMAGDGTEKAHILTTLKKQSAALHSDAERYSKLCDRAYKDKQEGVISDEEYRSLTAAFQQQKTEALEKLDATEKQIAAVSSDTAAMSPWIQEINQYGIPQKLDRRIVMALIDRVEVIDKKTIHIVFRHEAELRTILGEFRGPNGDLPNTAGRGRAV